MQNVWGRYASISSRLAVAFKRICLGSGLNIDFWIVAHGVWLRILALATHVFYTSMAILSGPQYIYALSLQSIHRQIGHMLDIIIINILLFYLWFVSRVTLQLLPSLSFSSLCLFPDRSTRFAFVVTVSLTWRHARGLVAQQPANKITTTTTKYMKINQRTCPQNLLFVLCSLDFPLFVWRENALLSASSLNQ